QSGSRPSCGRPTAAAACCRSRGDTKAYNAFSAFPEDALVRIEPGDIRKTGKVPKNGSLFFFQPFMSGPPKDRHPSPYFGEYPSESSTSLSSTSAIGRFARPWRTGDENGAG